MEKTWGCGSELEAGSPAGRCPSDLLNGVIRVEDWFSSDGFYRFFAAPAEGMGRNGLLIEGRPALPLLAASKSAPGSLPIGA